MSVASDQIISLMENVLFETPTMAAANWFSWAGQSQQNPAEAELGGLALGMANSLEFGIVDHVIGLFEGALSRDPSGLEVAYYVNAVEAGLTSAQLAQGMSSVPQAVWNQIATYLTASPEFTQSAVDPIVRLYNGFLDRMPSSAETAYYQKLLDGGTSVATLMQYFVNSTEYKAIHTADSLEVANFGVRITEANGAGQEDHVLGSGISNPLIVEVQPSGATYASQPSYVTFASWDTLIGVTDQTVLAVDTATIFSSSVTSVAGAITALESGIQAHHLAWGVYGGNTYVVESQTGVPGPLDTTVIELTGVHALSASTGAGLIHVLA